MFIDSHCHLDSTVAHDKYPITLDDIMTEAAAQNVSHMLSICCEPADFAALDTMTTPYAERVSLATGIHPLHINAVTEADLETLATQVHHPRVVGIGEMGLDRHYSQDADEHAKQQHFFEAQIELAVKVQKPIIIHTREARDATMAILRAGNAQACGGVLHCFTETLDMAKQALDIGFYISFSGILTFKNATQIQEVAQYVPSDRMLIETDSPYLAPVPHRGKTNRPFYVPKVAEFLAELRGEPLAQIAETTTENFYTLFKSARR